jgi:hypothetical protein
MLPSISSTVLHPKVLKLRQKLESGMSPKLKARDWLQPSSGIFRSGGFSTYVENFEVLEKYKSC